MAKKNERKKGRPAPRSRDREEREEDRDRDSGRDRQPRDRDRDYNRGRDRGSRDRGRGRRSGGGRKPDQSIAFSYKTKDGDWERGPSLGVWPTEIDNATGQGSVKDTYLRDLRKFLRDADEDGGKVNFTIFDNRKSRRDRDDDDDDPDHDDPDNQNNDKDDDKDPF